MKALFANLLTLFALALSPLAQTAPDAAYRQSFDKWKAELADDMKQNWVPLAGLFWLKPGENTFGADAANPIVLPAGSAPARAGSFVLTGSDVTVNIDKPAKASIAGKPITTAKLQSDNDSATPTVVELGALRMKVIVRGKRIGIRVKDLNSPAVRAYTGPHFYPLNLDYRVTATFIPADGKQTVDVPDVLGDVTPTPIAGTVKFTLHGQAFTLTDLGGSAAKGLFFVINDLTSKTDTYPGGRFIETDPVVDGKVVVDFNRAYSPPCSVTPYATCPLAPRENRLPIALRVGQTYERAQDHH